MKKRILSLLLILSILCLISCNEKETPAHSKPQVLYYRDVNETQPIRDTLVEWDDENDFIDDLTAPQERTIRFLEQSYETIYLYSYALGMADVKTHTYVYTGDTPIAFRIDANTGKLLSIAGAPYSHTAESESEYLAECTKILGDCSSKAQSYKYRTTTQYSKTDDQGEKVSQTVEGFYVPASNEQITERKFYFERYIDGIQTYQSYYVCFDEVEEMIVVKMYDWEYESAAFDKRSQFDMSSVLKEYLEENKRTDKELGNYHWKETMFIKNGNPYSAVRVYFDSGDVVDLFVKH